MNNIFKLSFGEYVAPERLETVFVQSIWVAQCYVYGDTLRSALVAVVVPDWEVIDPWATQKGKKVDHLELCRDPEVVAMILQDMKDKGKPSLPLRTPIPFLLYFSYPLPQGLRTRFVPMSRWLPSL